MKVAPPPRVIDATEKENFAQYHLKTLNCHDCKKNRGTLILLLAFDAVAYTV